MKKLVILLAFLMCSCGTITQLPPTVIKVDSTIVEYRDRIVHDTVDFVPPEFFISQVSTDTLSIIENDYAKTVAVVHDGVLSHSLQSVPAVIKVPVAVEVHDTLIVKSKADTVTEYIEVEKKLTKWQSFKMDMGGIVLFASLLMLAWILVITFVNKRT